MHYVHGHSPISAFRIDRHSATKAKDVEGVNIELNDQSQTPPLMPWREFADWIRMSDNHDKVRGWIRRGYIPTIKLGKHVMVNLTLLNQRLLDEDQF